jgi:iron complex outermembrane receptor protein
VRQNGTIQNNIGIITKYTLEKESFDLIAGIRAERQAYTRKDNKTYFDWTGNWQILQNPFLQIETQVSDITISAGCGVSIFHQNERNDWIYHVEPSLGFYYEDNRFANYNLAFSNNVNYPALHELFSSSSGNPDLKEESALKFEASTRQPFAAGSLSLSVFYNQIDNMVDKGQVGLYDDAYINIDQVNSYGMEAVIRYKFLSEHTLEYRFLDYSHNSERPLNENPKNIVTVSEKAKLPYKINVDYSLTWHDISNSYDTSTSQSHAIPSYCIHNAYISRSFNNLKLKLGLENIFDKNYEDKYGYPQSGIDFILSIETSI